MKFKKIIYTMLGLLLLNCGTEQMVDTEEITEAITSVLNAQSEAWNRRDLDTFMEGYWKSEELSFASGGMVNKGWESVLQRYKTNYTPEMMGHLTFADLEITPLGPESAFVIGTYMLAREPDNPEGKFTLVVRKFPDGWKIVHDHTSTRQR